MRTYFQKLLLILPLLVSCEEFLNIEPPKNELNGKNVFKETATIEAAFAHIYAELRETSFTRGSNSGLPCLLGYYADELIYLNESQQATLDFYNNSVLARNFSVEQIWNSSYNLIYDCNSILEGVEGNNSISQNDRDRFMGEAYFIRAFIYFHLTNLYGDIPFVDSTDYQKNSKAPKTSIEIVYERVIEDMLLAKELLFSSNDNIGLFRANHWTASAFLARIYLYHNNWERAKEEALYIIEEGPFALEQDLSSVFIKGSRETIWHLDPIAPGYNTPEAGTFISLTAPPRNLSLSEELLVDFEEGDQRFVNWVGAVSNEEETWYFPFKYKLREITQETMEYSILSRFSELFLIAAEASARLNQTSDALYYLNIIRNRASLPSISVNNQKELLLSILQERRIEFFSEQGHRFFDLKRTGRAHEVLSVVKPYWDETDILLPIPDVELSKNPNLLPQNKGY